MDEIFFGVDIDQIGALSKPGRIKKIPDSPEWLKGSVKYRDDTVPLVNLWKILGLNKPRKKVLLVPSAFDYCAFLISDVKGIYKLDTEKRSTRIYSLPYLKGFGSFREKVLVEMDLSSLLTEKQKKILIKAKKKNEKK
jgi:chemotaxis signal transduction protein